MFYRKDNYMKFLKGFSLGELIVTLTIIAFIAIITLPQLTRLRPNEEVLMLKKTYYLTGRVINELINDDVLYPEGDGEDGNSGGFSNTVVGRYHGIEAEGDSKFCTLVASRMNVRGRVDCDRSYTFTAGQAPEGNFTTTDGMVWALPIGNFAAGTEPTGNGSNIAQSIWIDVNGDKPGNCTYTDGNCSKPDRFEIKVDRWGKIYITDPLTRVYLQTTDNTKTHAELLQKVPEAEAEGDGDGDGDGDNN